MDICKDSILDLIKNHLSGETLKEMQFEIGQILNLSASTAYNKISGRNEFSVLEFLQLSQALEISIDRLLASHNQKEFRPVYFYADGLEQKPNSFLEYFEKVMDNVVKAKPSAENIKATFVCLQPHVFHLMKYPFLLYLKLYTYNLVNWRIASIDKYDPNVFLRDEQTMALIKKLYHTYLSIPIAEMVGHNFIHPMCSQLEYLIKSGIISDPEHLKQIKVDLYQFLEDMEEVASKGVNTNSLGKETPVEIYINKFIHVSNIILIETEEGGLLTIQCDVPEVVKTYDPIFIEHFKKWLNSNKEFAIYISKTGGLERKDFFQRNKKHIEMVMEDLEKSVTKI
ncbi:MAG: hypothetical protein WAT79_17300 [Saprospiraceae bacterium]